MNATAAKPEKKQVELAQLANPRERKEALKQGKLALKVNGEIIHVPLIRPIGRGHKLAMVLGDEKQTYFVWRENYDPEVHGLTLTDSDGERIGIFGSEFGHRVIDDGHNRKGIGTLMLAYLETIRTAHGMAPLAPKTRKQSTALLLLKNGYKLNPYSPITEAQVRQHKTEELPLEVRFEPKRISAQLTAKDFEQTPILVADRSGKPKWHIVKRREK